MDFAEIKQSLNNILTRANEHAVVVLEAPQAGPTVCLSALTHGNEISGVITAASILEKLQGGELELKAGRLKLLLANYEILAEAESLEELIRHRGVDLNRIWDDAIDEVAAGQPGAGEFAIRKRLLPVISQADFLIDLHSTSQPSTPIGIALADSAATMGWLAEHLDVPFLLPNISNYLNGTAMIDRHHAEARTNATPRHFSLVIEAGQHFDFSTIERNTANVERLLKLCGILAGEPERVSPAPLQLEVYKTGYSSAIGEAVDWIYTDSPKGFDQVSQGTELCRLAGETVVADHDSYIVMPQLKSNRVGQELFYLAKPYGH